MQAKFDTRAMEPKKTEKAKSNPVLRDFLVAFLVPTLINKTLMLYFGIHYAEYPGRGYGYGLAATIAFLFLSLGRFVWKYRNVEDP